jgi:hypothetical protein
LAFIYVALSWLLNKIFLGDPHFESILYPFWPCSSPSFSLGPLCRTFLATKQDIPRWSLLWIHPLSFVAFLFILISWFRSMYQLNKITLGGTRPLGPFFVDQFCSFSNSAHLLWTG